MKVIGGDEVCNLLGDGHSSKRVLYQKGVVSKQWDQIERGGSDSFAQCFTFLFKVFKKKNFFLNINPF